jgi:hypothetical protein
VQLIRGGREPALRARGLLPALAVCEQLGYIPSGRAVRLRAAYRFLRRLENRVQMFGRCLDLVRGLGIDGDSKPTMAHLELVSAAARTTIVPADLEAGLHGSQG